MKRIILFLSLIGIVFSGFAQKKAEITKISIPDEMNPSTNVQVYVVIKNTGEEELNRSNCKIEVTCKSCPDKDAGENFEYEHDLVLGLNPQKEYTFRWLIKTPTVPGDYNLSIQIKNGTSVLDKEDVTVTIEENFEAEITNNIEGLQFEPERIYPPMTFTVKNTGKTTWDKGSYQLIVKTEETPDGASYNDKEAFEFEKDIDLSNLEPGKSVSVSSYPFDSPTQGGDYKLKVTVEKDGKTFDAKNAEITITAIVTVEEYEVYFSEKVTRKIYPNKEYSVSFTVKNSGKIKWPEGKFSIKATLTSKASSKVNDNVFEATESFDASEWDKGESTTVTLPKIKAPVEHGRYKVTYQILVDGKEFEADDSSIDVQYEVVELQPELNVDRITLEKRMSPGKTYKLKVDINNNGEIIANKNDWEVKCKIRTKKPSNYKPPRGVFEFSLDGTQIEAKKTKYLTGSIKCPKVDKETSIRLEFEVYFKGRRMGGPKTYDIIIKP